MLLAEMWDSFDGWVRVILAAVTGAAAAVGTVMALVHLTRRRRIALARATFELEKAQAQAVLAAEKERVDALHREEAEDVKALRDIIEDLRKDIVRQRAEYTRLQRSVTDKLSEGSRLLHECETKHAVLEERHKWLDGEQERTKRELADNTAYTKSLESRIGELERHQKREGT